MRASKCRGLRDAVCPARATRYLSRVSGVCGIAVLLCAGSWAMVARDAGAAPVLELRGGPLPEHSMRAVLDPALRAPGDSVALGRALGVLVQGLEERGYWSARARGAWDGERLVVTVTAGARVRLRGVTLRVTPPADSVRFAAAFEPLPQAAVGPVAFGDLMTRAVRRLTRDGYAHAELSVLEWRADSTEARITLAGVLGPQVTVTGVRVEGLEVTTPAVAQRALGRLAGLPFQPEQAEAARERLVQLGLFTRVTYEGLESAGDWSRGQLVYRVEEPHYNRFEGVVGTEGAGTVGTFDLALGNLLGTGRTTALHWDATGPRRNHLGARYTEPLVAGLPLRLEVALDQEVRDTLYTRTRWGGSGRWTLTSEDGVTLGFEEERVVQEHTEVEEARLENTSFGLERVTLDDPLGPTRGARVRLVATQTFKRETLRPPGSRSASASAVTLASEWVRPLGSRTGLGLEVDGAGRFSSERVLPVFERFPLGGASSLRGFDEGAFRVDHYVLSRLEWRTYLGSSRQRAYLFWDHAWAETRRRAADSRQGWDRLNANGVGFGFRIETAAGLAGIDYGLEPGRPALEGKLHLRLVSTF